MEDSLFTKFSLAHGHLFMGDSEIMKLSLAHDYIQQPIWEKGNSI